MFPPVSDWSPTVCPSEGVIWLWSSTNFTREQSHVVNQAGSHYTSTVHRPPPHVETNQIPAVGPRDATSWHPALVASYKFPWSEICKQQFPEIIRTKPGWPLLSRSSYQQSRSTTVEITLGVTGPSPAVQWHTITITTTNSTIKSLNHYITLTWS